MMPRLSTLSLSLALLTPSAFADGLPVEPGLWEITSTMTMPMLGQPRVNTVSECMEDDEISMDDMGTEGLDPSCTFEVAKVEGNTMTWSFDCPLEGGSSHGEWTAVSSGDSVTGGGSMTMNLQGQSMEMTMSWEGRRVGDCP